MERQRCSIAFCPWRAKYFFEGVGSYSKYGRYQECWFHYEEMPLINWAWDLITHPIKKMFYWLRFRLCGEFKRGDLLYWVELKFLLTPRLHRD